MMEMIEGFLRRTGAPHFLAIGIVLIVLWLLISGFIRGLKKRRQDKDSKEDNNED